MGRLRLQCRWAPWWFSLISFALYAPLLYGVYTGLRHPQDEGQAIRIFLPIFVILSYLELGVLTNRQIAVIEPEGVSTMLRPLPLGNGHRIPRSAIESLYIGRIRLRKRGTVVEEFFSMGVRTRAGDNIDLQSHHASLEEATRTGRQVQQIIDVELFRDDTLSPNPAFRRTALLWVGLFLLATLAGAAWEIGSGG